MSVARESQDTNVIENCSDSERERTASLQLAQNSLVCPMLMFEDLNRMYEGRIGDIEKEANGDSQLKCIVYKEWIDTLINTQYHVLDALSEVETAANQRSSTLGRALEFETQSGHINQFSKMKTDIANLLHLIKRAIVERKWNTEGLKFQTFTIKDIFGGSLEQCTTPANDMQNLNSELLSLSQQVKILEAEKNNLKKELDTKDIQLRRQKANTPSGSRGIDEVNIRPPCTPFDEDSIFKDLICELKQAEALRQEKLRELANCLKENETLRNELQKYKCQIEQKDKVITNIKALTIEVADKHDQIQQMRTQIFALEDELKKAEKKIQFKDNVVKELRRDCKNASKNCVCGKTDLSPISRSVSPDPSHSPKESDFAQFISTDLPELGKTSQNLSAELVQCKMDLTQCDDKNKTKILEKELENLICLQTSCDTSVEVQQSLAQQQKRVIDLVQQLMIDLKKANNKLNYVRGRLFAIAYPCDANVYEPDSGYASSEDLEPESTIVETIRARIDSIKKDNENLRSQVAQLHLEIRSATSVGSCGGIQQEDASANLNAPGKERPNHECKGTQMDKPSLEETVMSLQSELFEKEIIFEKHAETLNSLKQKLTCLKEENIELRQLSKLKDEELIQLRKETLYQEDIISGLEDDKEEAGKQLELVLEDVIVLERVVIQLKDEKELLKEIIIGYEAHFQNIQQKYLHLLIGDRIQRQQMQNQEQKYLDIINDLTTELASLSTQVSMAQEEFSSNAMSAPFEASFRELESQNDLLQKTIESFEHKIFGHEIKLKSYEAEIEQLKSEKGVLESELEKKDIKYEELYNGHKQALQMLHKIKASCRCSAGQSIKLDGAEIALPVAKRPHDLQHIFEMLDRKSEELKALKEYSSEEKNKLTKSIRDLEDQLKQIQIETSLVKNKLTKKEDELRIANNTILEYVEQNEWKSKVEQLQEELNEAKSRHRETEAALMCENTTLQKNLDETSKALLKANDTVSNLERQTHGYRKQGDVANKENALLKAEIFSVKENLAGLEGLERSLREQLRKTQDELNNAKHDIERFVNLKNEVEDFRRCCNKLKDSNYTLFRQYNMLVDEYNILETEFRKLLEIKGGLMQQLEIFRNWQHDQCEQDKLIELKISKREDHIKTLLEDRQVLIDKVYQLHRDNLLIGGELENYKNVFSDSLSETHTRASLSLDGDSRTENMELVIKKIRRTARKLSQTRSVWQNGIRRFSD